MKREKLEELILGHLPADAGDNLAPEPRTAVAREIVDALEECGLNMEPGDGAINIIGRITRPLDCSAIAAAAEAAGVTVGRINVGQFGDWVSWTPPLPATWSASGADF